MTDIHDRLRQARQAAGFSSIQGAVDQFGWKYSTYSGHENGSRGLKPEPARRYAKAFGVDASWLLLGKDGGAISPGTDQPQAPVRPLEFSEPTAEPYIARSHTEGRAVTELARHLAPNVRSPALFCLNATHLDFGLMRGDILVVDLKPQPRDGRLALANIADPETGSGLTALCRLFGDLVIYPAAETRDLPARTDDETLAILGTVHASMRPEAEI